MEIKNFEDAIKAHKEFGTKLSRTLGALRKGKAPGLAELVRQHEESIARTQKELSSLQKQREAMVRRWDQRIEHHKTNLAEMEKGLAEFKKKLASEGKSGGKGTKSSSPKKK